MSRILGFFFLCISSLSASSESMSSIEADANARAKTYAAEVAEINKMLNHTQQSGEIVAFTQTLRDKVKTEEPIAQHLKKVSQVVVFLSFSMPERSLHAWLLQCKHSGATPVIRGLIHNSFQETLSTIVALSKKTGVGMQLDPVLFKTFEINQVPAVVYIKDTPSCPANMNCKSVVYDILYGDVSLDYALEKINEGQSTQSVVLEQMLSRLRGFK